MIAAGEYGALRGRSREQAGQELVTKCIRGDFDSPGRAWGSGRPPTPSGPVLRTFHPTRCAVLTTDASKIAIAAILTQQDDESHPHPVAYESRKLTAAERNYLGHVLKLLAVVHNLRTFRHYLLLAAGRLGRWAVGPTLTCGRTTRRSRGSRRINI